MTVKILHTITCVLLLTTPFPPTGSFRLGFSISD